jgi:hypothetical protein
MDERSEKISELLHEAGEAHHVVYRITDGADDDWASWYSEWLTAHSELPDLLGKPPVRSHLTHALVELERDFDREKPGGKWEDFYAQGLVERFGS